MPTVLLLTEGCCLDHANGAAHSGRAMLEALARRGDVCHTLAMTLYEGEAERATEWAPSEGPSPVEGGEPLRVRVEAGVTHWRYPTMSSRRERLRPWEAQAFVECAHDLVSRLKPDLVLTYDGVLLNPVLAAARLRGAQVVAYLADPGRVLNAPAPLAACDGWLAPSQAMARLCRERLGVVPQVVRDLVVAHGDGRRNLLPERLARRAERAVTMINPEPNKGGLLFINIVAQALKQAPTLRFVAVEGRWGRAQWQAAGVDVAGLTNLSWVARTRDMAAVYERSALLLVPSLGFEASGRVIAEALLAGVPVLATRSGGIEEQVNEGGFLFDIPASMRSNFLASPELAELRPWLHYIRSLLNDESLYREAVQLALKASEVFRREQTEPALYAALVPFMAPVPATPPPALVAANACASKGDAEGADRAYTGYMHDCLRATSVMRAIKALRAGDAAEWPAAFAALESHLREQPYDIAALGLLADLATKQAQTRLAVTALQRQLELAPGFVESHRQLLRVLQEAGREDEALAHCAALCERFPGHAAYLGLYGALLVKLGRFHEGLKVYETLLAQHPGKARDWMYYALALKTLGYQQEGVAAYRQAIALAPEHGATWHGLSNMKLAVFDEADIAAMQAQLARSELRDDDRYNMHFALAKALEDRQQYAPSFEHYARANAVRRSMSDFDVGRVEDYVAQAKEAFSADFFAARADWGCSEPDPVFVLGLHRAGSTLTEQILASHSRIEGTRELPQMLRIGRHFGAAGGRDSNFQTLQAGLLQDLSAGECSRLGQRYLDETRAERKTTRPLFVDKMPANWMYAGLIHLILPRARIIDVRRAPMSAGFALFKMNFGRGVDYAYSQRDIARYYRAYADLMAHFDTVLPGRIHHLQYERLVEDTDAEIRRLIDYCGLPFEEGCLRYWETERAVQTPSSEQVRKPIYREGLEQWRHYAPWLGEMQAAFGDALSTQGAGR